MERKRRSQTHKPLEKRAFGCLIMTLQKNGEHKSWLSQLNKSDDRTFLAVLWKRIVFFCCCRGWVEIISLRLDFVEFVFFCSRSDKIDAQWRERRPCSVEKRVYYSPCTTHYILYVVGSVVQSHSSLSPFLPLFLYLFHIDVFNLSANIFQTGSVKLFFSHSNSEILWQWLCLLCKGMSVWMARTMSMRWGRKFIESFFIDDGSRAHTAHNRAATHGVKMWQFFQIIFQYTRSLAPFSRRAEKYEKWLKNLFSVQLSTRRSKIGRKASGKVEKVSNLDFSSLHDSIKIAEVWENRQTSEKILWKIYYIFSAPLSPCSARTCQFA